MFGWWYIFFIALALMVVSAVLIFRATKKREMWLKKWRIFHASKEEHEMASKKYDTWDNIHTGVWASFTLSCITSFILLLVCIIVPIEAKKELAYFKQQSNYVESAVLNGTDLENIAITQTIISQNKWLAEAKASLSAYGVFSSYYNSGLEELKPIVIKR